jgi:hypothetical protein
MAIIEAGMKPGNLVPKGESGIRAFCWAADRTASRDVHALKRRLKSVRRLRWTIERVQAFYREPERVPAETSGKLHQVAKLLHESAMIALVAERQFFIQRLGECHLIRRFRAMQLPDNRKTLKIPEKTYRQHQLLLDKLGYLPKLSLEAMDGYGLNDEEIGHYFQVTPSSIRRLRRAFSDSGGLEISI